MPVPLLFRRSVCFCQMGVKVTTVNPAFYFPCFLESTSQYHVKKNKQRGLLRIYLKQSSSGSSNNNLRASADVCDKIWATVCDTEALQSGSQHPILHPKRSQSCTMQARKGHSSILDSQAAIWSHWPCGESPGAQTLQADIRA